MKMPDDDDKYDGSFRHAADEEGARLAREALERRAEIKSDVKPPNDQESQLIQAIRDWTGLDPVLTDLGIVYKYRSRDGTIRSRTSEYGGRRHERIVAIRNALIAVRSDHDPPDQETKR